MTKQYKYDIIYRVIFMTEYIKKYGNKTFGEKEFNAVDNLVFSQLAYTDFGGIVGLKSSIKLKNASKEFFDTHSEEEIDDMIGISKKSAALLKACADTKRFGEVMLCHYVNNINDGIDKQFSAISFILDDGSFLTAFRGTDITVTGTKESAMLSYMFPVPAQIESLYYFQECAMMHSGDIRIVGHSKGGNLAVFAAVNCSNSLKKRIKAVYEDDAPGFPKWFFDRYDYKQIEDKIHLYTPQGSIIGRMLYHDKKPIIVKSTNTGLKQHQVSSWVIEDDHPATEEKYDAMSDFTEDYINTLIDYVGDDDLALFFDTLEYLAESIGIDDFYDIKTIDIKKCISLIDNFSKLDEKQKDRFKQIIKKASADFAKEYISEKAEGIFKTKILKPDEDKK